MNRYLLIIFILQLTFSLTSCSEINSSKDDNKNNKKLLNKLSEKYEDVGTKHNEGLDSIIEDFSKLESIESKKQAFDLVDRFGTQYLENQSRKNPEFKFAEKIYKKNVKRYSKPFKKGKINGVRNKSKRVLDTLSSISNKQKVYLNKIETSLDENKSLRDFKNSLEKIEKSASKELPEEELELIVISITVAKSSATYWSKNSEKWEEIIANKIENSEKIKAQDFAVITNGPEEPEEFDISWQQLANTDVVAASTSAAVTLITGCEFYTLGACTAAAGIGGGLVGSAVDGLSQLVGETYDYFFNYQFTPIHPPLKNITDQDKELYKFESVVLKEQFQS